MKLSRTSREYITLFSLCSSLLSFNLSLDLFFTILISFNLGIYTKMPVYLIPLRSQKVCSTRTSQLATRSIDDLIATRKVTVLHCPIRSFRDCVAGNLSAFSKYGASCHRSGRSGERAPAISSSVSGSN